MKRLFTLFILITVFVLFTVPASATDIAASESTEAINTASGQTTQLSADEENGGEANDGDNVNVFEAIYKKASEHAGEIFSILTLIGTALLSLSYKKGLTPLISKSLTALGSAVSGIKERTEEGTKALCEGSAALTEGLERTEGMIASLTDRINALKGELSVLEDIGCSQQAMQTIMKTQIEMLNDIFMSSSLPQYQKAAAAERLTEMREALKNAEALSD